MAQGPDTLVLFMGRSLVRTACAELMRRGRRPELPAALVVNGTLPDQVVVRATLATLADRVEPVLQPGPGLIWPWASSGSTCAARRCWSSAIP